MRRWLSNKDRVNILSKHCKRKRRNDPNMRGSRTTFQGGGGVIGILGGEGRGPRPIFEFYYGNSINFPEI